MPSRCKALTGKSIKKRLAKGFGQGEKESYQPYLRVSDVPSNGTSSIITGWKHGREHHLLSRNERNYFYCLEWSDDVLEIREQFPLVPLESTFRLAQSLGLRHPGVRGELTLMTTDFLILVRSGNGAKWIARTIKPEAKLMSSRVLQKFEIERRFFAERGIDWGIVTDKDIPEAVWRNMDWLHECRAVSRLRPLIAEDIDRIRRHMVSRIAPEQKVQIAQFCLNVDRELHFVFGTSLKVFRHLVATKVLGVDIQVRLQTDHLISVRALGIGDLN
jgi:TnsA endonuclease N terminal/TnsA endonuclease C terminal